MRPGIGVLGLVIAFSATALGQAGFNEDRAWRGGEIAVGTDKAGCTWFFIVDARWTFVRGTAKPEEAIFSKGHMDRLVGQTQANSCKLALITLRTWDATLSNPESSSSKVSTRFLTCKGEICGEVASKNVPFTTTLSLVKGQLIDTDKDDPDGLVYWNESYHHDVELSVDIAVKQATPAFDGEGNSRPRDIPFSAHVVEPTRSQLMSGLTNLPQHLEQFGGVSSRSRIETQCVPRLRVFNGSRFENRAGEFCYVSNTLITRESVKLLEQMAWSREGGRWTLLGYYVYGGRRPQ